MTPRLLFLLLLCVTLVARAEVYRWKDAQGNVIFSDTPHEGAEIIEIGPTTVVPGEPVEKTGEQPAAVKPDDPNPYQSIAVVAPSDDATLRDQQSVGVDVTTVPELLASLGHKIQLYVDGTAFGGPSSSPHFVLPEADRGSHQLAAAVIDAAGRELIRSTATVFHLHKTSVADPKTGKSKPPNLSPPPPAK